MLRTGCADEGEGDRVGAKSIRGVVASQRVARMRDDDRPRSNPWIQPRRESGLLGRFRLYSLSYGGQVASRNDVTRNQALASEATTSPAARSPLSRAPCAVEKKFREVASPAKNRRPSTGVASTARSPAWP